MKFHAAQLLALLPFVSAQRPNGTSICNYYTNALLNSTNATAQYTVLTLLVNTAVIGNWSANTFNVKVNGILNPGTYGGANINLLPYFDGSLKSSNRSGVATSVNFLDGGGAAPLKMAMPANGTTGNQYRLLTHLYQFFGALLGCSQYGMDGFPAYMGSTNMGAVHGFMALGPNANNYFIQQVGLAAASFGVATADITAVAMSLNNTFNYRCSAPMPVLPMSAAEPQAICQAASCPTAPNATCGAYAAVVQPQFINGTNFTAPTANSTTGGSSGSGTASGTGASATRSGSAAPINLPALSGLGSVLVGLVGFLAL